jgi:transcription elongation factor GreA
MVNSPTSLAEAGPTITIGSKIVIRLNGAIKQFQIVGSADVDSDQGKISYLSPVGEAVLGRKVGEEFEITLPSKKKLICKLIKVF